MVPLALITLAVAAQMNHAAAPRVLETPAQVRALCEALLPQERFTARGDAVARGRAEADHEARREAAVNERYRVVVSADRLRFAAYDAEEQLLSLSDRTLLTTAGGSLRVFSADEPGLPVTADTAAAQRVTQAAARGTLALALVFELDEDATCSHANGTTRYALGVDAIAWEYVEKSEVLARGGGEPERPAMTAAQGAQPRVEVAEPLGGGGREVRSAVEARSGELEACYRRALQREPGLDGSLVAEFLEEGGARSIRMAADSVLDDDMTACVRGVLARVSLPQGEDVRAAIPIHFVLEQPRVAEQQGTGAAP